MDFWARRRAAVEAEAKAEDAQHIEAAVAEREAAQARKTDAELLEELGLPEPETLGADGDFKAFLAEGVPQRLKSRALRCLWRSNPLLANVDGLVDYGEDFTDATCVVENMQTAYQVGKGMLRHVEELARQAEQKAAKEAESAIKRETASDVSVTEPDTETEAAGTPAEHAEREVLMAGSEPEIGATYIGAPSDPSDQTGLPPRRRMAFTFDETHA